MGARNAINGGLPAAFGELLDAVPDAMIVAGADGLIVRANHHTEQLFGYDEHELVGEAIERLVPERLADRHRTHREAFVTDPVVRPMGAGLQLFGRRRNGDEFPIEVSLSPFPGQSGLVLAAIRDITERNRVEARLRELDGLKDEFLSIVSHELRTPLTAISGFAELLNRPDSGIDEASRDAMLRRIIANVDDMRRMIEELLDLSMLQAGRVEVDLRPLDLSAAIRECIARTDGALGNHSVELDAPDRVDVIGDFRAIERVATNLITNAAKFSPDGAAVFVRVEPGDTEATVSVSDQGPGIPAELHEVIFERFYQAGRARSAPGARGVGIGLSVVARYVALLRGSLRVDSAAGKGATFSFTVPSAPVRAVPTGRRHDGA